MESLQQCEVPLCFESDNTTALKIIGDGYSSKLSSVSRSIRLTISTLHDLVHDGANSARYVPTEKNVADILSKAFTSSFPPCLADIMDVDLGV